MAFIVNYDQAQQEGFLAPEGDYETIISQAKFDLIAGGRRGSGIPYLETAGALSPRPPGLPL